MSGAFGRPFKFWVRRAGLRIIRRAPLEPIPQWNIVKGDTVQVLTGRSSGKTGKVLKVIRRKNRVIVEGLNLVNRHVRPRPNAPGGVLVKESPIHYSNLMLVDPPTGKPTRIERRWTEDGTAVRVSKRSGSVIPTPAEAIGKGKAGSRKPGPRDTPSEVAHRVTYVPPAHLVPYLSASSDLFRIRGPEEARKPEAVREGHVDRRAIRNRMLAQWRKADARQRLAALAEEHGVPLPAGAAAAPAEAAATPLAASRQGWRASSRASGVELR